MAVVQLADIHNPVTFGRRTQEAQLQLNRFLRSGIATPDSRLAAQLAQGGNTGYTYRFNMLTNGEPNYSSDDPAVKSTPAKISGTKLRFMSSQRNKSWSTMNLARELAEEDPVGAITGRVGQYWATDDEQRLLASILGILAGNVANDSGDMVVSVASDSSAAVTDAERIGGERVLDALQTMGDHKTSLTTMAIHSKIHSRLQKQNLITFVPNNSQDVGFGTYMGKTLLVDDSLPAVAGTNRITYTCIMFGGGIVGYAAGKVLHPSEVKRDPDAGNGGGQDTIFSRVHNVWSPYGFDFTGASVAGQSPNYAELKAAANWNRIDSRKNIPLAFINVND